MTSEETKNPTSSLKESNSTRNFEEDPESGFVRGWMNPQRAKRRNEEIQQSEVRFHPQQSEGHSNSGPVGTNAVTVEEEESKFLTKIFSL